MMIDRHKKQPFKAIKNAVKRGPTNSSPVTRTRISLEILGFQGFFVTFFGGLNGFLISRSAQKSAQTEKHRKALIC